MPAYVISDVEAREPTLIDQYRALAEASIAKYGGRYIARGGTIDAVEGDWSPKHIVVVEFPSLERARDASGTARLNTPRRSRFGSTR